MSQRLPASLSVADGGIALDLSSSGESAGIACQSCSWNRCRAASIGRRLFTMAICLDLIEAAGAVVAVLSPDRQVYKRQSEHLHGSQMAASGMAAGFQGAETHPWPGSEPPPVCASELVLLESWC
ncbi:hypothetical protein NDU88_006016 [Pleurodeles waltl]|uniref:Uncharacterized protein n=1 Tax=Pleurodeles waltl TaxID=8319 RepID=A0AAV7WF05_PLEWA|nr:hypothetical protein NDU88_006016 [Pleurodeles waltl]